MPRLELIGRSECARVLGMHPDTWDRYWVQHADLVDACRTVRVDPKSRGRRKWPRAVIEAHAREVCV